MPGVGLIRSKLRPSRWLSPKSKQSFTKRRLLITVSSKSFSARCANSVSKCSSDRHRESANAPVENIPKVPYLSAILRRFFTTGALRAGRHQEHFLAFLKQIRFAGGKLIMGIENIRMESTARWVKKTAKLESQAT